jgi:hypothetical protein
MLFNVVGTIHSHLSQEQRLQGFARRAEWKYPTGLNVTHEIWRSAAPELVATFEAESYEPIMAMQLHWQDFFQLNISPATTPEQGLQIAGKLMKK